MGMKPAYKDFVVKPGRQHFENMGVHEMLLEWIPDK